MTEAILNTTDLLNKSFNNQLYKFQLPTVATRLEPVFEITFRINDADLGKNNFDVVLNPKLANQAENEHWVKQYKFNDEGVCLFKNEEFGAYFMEGEIKMQELNLDKSKQNCFIQITYGNRDEALHYIKGNFQLTEFTS
jgi:hypothetical protein